MKKLKYEINLNATKKMVWDALTNKEKFNIWARAFSPNSTYEGSWEEGSEINFIDAGRGGTVARLDEVTPYKRIEATHIATLTPDRVRETKGEFTEKWIGTKEIYELEERAGKTTLKIEMQSHPDYCEMFDSGWPRALENIKQLVEK